MTDAKKSRLVKLNQRGQITIPADYREHLGIDEDSLFQLRLKGPTIEMTPLRIVDPDGLVRQYDATEIEAFLEEDKLDKETAAKARKLLGG